MANITGTNNDDLNLLGTVSDDQLYGLAGDDTLNGGSGDDLLDGGSGDDDLQGGIGDDVYLVDSLLDVVTEATNAGSDLVRSTVSFSLGSYVEDLTLLGSANINATGNGQSNVLLGNSGANVLNGGAGADFMSGGNGNDSYIVDNALDEITEVAAGGVDTVSSTVSYALDAHLENLTLTSSNSVNATGNALNNFLIGNSGANVLAGGAGDDTMSGGAGNDTYDVDSGGDVVNEDLNQGVDLVRTTVDYALSDDVENLTLLGGARNGSGNLLNNLITGNALANQLDGVAGDDKLYGQGGNDVLVGGEGNDVLDGQAGIDSLNGGAGNDSYYIDAASEINQAAADLGIDTINSTLSYTLGANQEHLTLLGSLDLDGIGNAGRNVLTGNSGNNVLDGGASDDVLIGGAGQDFMIGGTGNDIFVVDDTGGEVLELSAEGTDTVKSSVSYTLAANIEYLRLQGAGHINGAGNSLNNFLFGNNGNNTLDGGPGGADSLSGGLGNDTYIIDSSGDRVTEGATAGLDTVRSSISLTLGANVENLVLTGNAALSGTGNSLDNVITGNNTGNVLDGALGRDTLQGGLGNDTLVFDDLDVMVDGGAGSDTLRIDDLGSVLNLAAISSLRSIERVDLGNGGNTINVDAATIVALSDNNALVVDGGPGDSVSAAGTWTSAGSFGAYARYTQGTATLDVALNVDRSGINLVDEQPGRSENVAPINLLPATQSGVEDTALVFSTARGNALRVSDDQSGPLTVSLSAAHGTLSVAQLAGQASIVGQASATLTLHGSVADINASLDGLRLAPPANFNGASSLSMSTSDGTLGDVDVLAINFSAINDAPLNVLPGAQNVNEDGSLAFIGANTLRVSDVDSGAGTLTVNLSVGHGSLSLAGSSGVSGDLNGADGVLNLIGSLSAVNAALQGLSYRPAPNFQGADTLQINSSDGALNDSDSLAITVNAQNDAPQLLAVVLNPTSTEAGVGTNSVALLGSAAVSDADASNFSGGRITVAFTDTYQSGDALSVNAALTGVGSVSGGAASALVVNLNASATSANVAAILNSLSYRNSGDNPTVAGTDTARNYTVTFNDGGNGSAVSLNSNVLSGTINLIGQNDTPVIASLHGDNGSYSEGAPAILVNQGTLATVSDLDSSNFAGGSLSVAISAGGNIAQDVLGIQSGNVTVGGGSIVAGAAISVGGVQIGTIASNGDGVSGRALVVNFDADATAARIASLVNAVTYRNLSTTSATLGAHTLRFTLNDGDGATTFADTTVNVLNSGSSLVTVAGFNVSALNGSNGFNLFGWMANDMAGRYVDSAGDLNGDGLADIVIGAPGADSTATAHLGEGRAYVVLGDTSAAALDGMYLEFLNGGNGGFRLDGGVTAGAAGTQVVGAGDMNGDNLADLAISTPNSAGSSSSTAVFFGRAGDNAASDTFNLESLTPSDHSGLKLTTSGFVALGKMMDGAGDFNGDGLSDLAVGHTPLSQAYLVFGQSNYAGNLAMSAGMSTSNAINFSRSDFYDGFGAIGYAGDVDGDGLDDLLLGMPGLFSGEDGKVVLLYGTRTPATLDNLDLSTLVDSNQASVFQGPLGSLGELGRDRVTGLGDINGDGRDDFAMVAPYTDIGGRINSGSVFVVYGNASRAALGATNLASLNGANGFRVDGGTNGAPTGYELQVSAAGDVNGDGIDDFMVGDSGFTSAQGGARVYVVFGSRDGFNNLNGDTLNSVINGTLDQNADGKVDGFQITGPMSFGRSVTSAGDVNGDGYDDLVIGAFQQTDAHYVSAGAAHVVYGRDFRAEKSAGATSGADILVGSAGADSIDGLGGADSIRSGAGNDVVIYRGTELRIDGGGDLSSLGSTIGDTLKIGVGGLDLDLVSASNNRFTNIESIDMRGVGSNALSLGVQDLLDLSDSTDNLFVRGDAGGVDSVDVAGLGFSSAGTKLMAGVTYADYTVAGFNLHLFVEQNVNVVV